jgi:hypothetical protein
MTTYRAVAISASMAIAVFASSSTHANSANLSLIGASSKVCQLTGDTDWPSNQPTAAQTNTRFGLQAVDLGFPVDSGSRALYFLFGDAFPGTSALNPISPDDALGLTVRTAPPDSAHCLDLNLLTSGQGGFAHPTVHPAILQGAFNVPTGGVFVGNDFYAFFWTDHCVAAQPLTPLPDTPLQRPAPVNATTCPEIPLFSSIGRSVITRNAPTGLPDFDQVPGAPSVVATYAAMPSGFVYVSASRPAPAPSNILTKLRPDIPVFGVARYRASIPYLAMAPQNTFGDPTTWKFLGGMVSGQPQWLTRAQWESQTDASGNWLPPAGAELYADSIIDKLDERCVGEHSVTWNEPLQTWLLTYVCGLYRVETRTAPNPWGPWSEPTVLLSLKHDPSVVCTLIMDPFGSGCPSQPPLPSNGIGLFYGPFVMARYTQDTTPSGVKGLRQAQVYWLLSTWNPYRVVVMTSTLRMTDKD